MTNALLLLWTIFLRFYFVSGQTTRTCAISFNQNLLRASDPRLIGGYNDVLGPVQNLTFDDDGLLLTSHMLYNGILRHPGGTVANYWNLSNASYANPCNTSHYDNCNHEASVDLLPKMTFSAANFSNGIGISSPLYNNMNEKDKKRIGVVYDLNILTLEGQGLIDQVDFLHSTVGGDNVQYIECGNEYYLNQYAYEFPNSTVYMNKVLPVIAEIRKLFGDSNNTKIAVPATRALPGQRNAWNDGLAAFKDKYDSVTVHDYSLNDKVLDGLNEQEQLSVISIYGKAALPNWIAMVNEEFGEDKTIFMTEYNTQIKNQSSWLGYSVLHSMFAMSYMSSAICDTTQTMELLMWQLYATQNGHERGTYKFATSLSAMANDLDSTTFDVIGQIFAQIGYIAMVKNNRMTCLDISAADDSQCPLVGVDIMGNDKLQCVYGIGFNNDSDTNSLGFALVNACAFDINIDLDLKSMANINTNIELEVYEYSYKSDGGTNAKFTKCKEGDNVWDQECAAVYADYSRINISSNEHTLSTKISQYSLILAATK